MSNPLQNLVPILDGSNYHRWADLMKAYLQQQQVWFVVELPDGITAPTLAEDGSNQNDVVKDKTTAKEVWNELKELYSVTSALGAYSLYKVAANTRIPANEHPGPAIAKIQGNLDQLASVGIDVPMNLRALIILDAAPPRYETAIQLVLNDNKLKDLTTSDIREALVASWESSVTRGSRKLGEAKKLSAIKRKGKDPSFRSQQQQQQRQNGSGNSQQQRQKGKARRGKRKGQKSSDNDHDHAHLASTATISDGPTATVDPRALLRKPVRVNGPEGESKYPTLKRAFNLARDLDITPSLERIRTLEGVIKAVDKGEGTSRIVEVTSDTDSADSHSSKRTRLTLAERIDWTERDDDVESAISLGDEEDDVDMDIAQAAGLYEQYDEQVRSVPLTLPNRQHADALSIAAISNGVEGSAVVTLRSNVCNFRNLCSHSRLYSECTRCKGKSKTDHNEPLIWMLDSGASSHFTFDLDDFVEYEPLQKEMLVGTANGVAVAKGSGTVMLNCPLNPGEHTTVRIAPVYYMPDLSIRLLSMGEFLQEGMRVSGNADKISIFEANGKPFLAFHPRHPDDTIFVIESAAVVILMHHKPVMGLARIALRTGHSRNASGSSGRPGRGPVTCLKGKRSRRVAVISPGSPPGLISLEIRASSDLIWHRFLGALARGCATTHLGQTASQIGTTMALLQQKTANSAAVFCRIGERVGFPESSNGGLFDEPNTTTFGQELAEIWDVLLKGTSFCPEQAISR
ncbi:hypothetical protein NUW54_g2534 [Trametes sanguinea]|uniref:Uncharacterized protein n=1 Tax=Trametes sanguinea TaxID=158606 RepID=A0ACC1Q3I1_9APHY|nr:hypothetical protein NUW54_g2534 [Trametes sanguinea]